MPYGRKLGLIDDATYGLFLEKTARVQSAIAFLEGTSATLPSGERISLKAWLKMPENSWPAVLEYGQFRERLSDDEMKYVESEVKYEGYILKQEREIERMTRLGRMTIPADMDFGEVSGLTREAAEKLRKFRPATLGEAKKIPGVTPAAVMNILAHLSAKKEGRGAS
jgi:tRNA uridine 5-carboxymethylaminomethyl modification enzyme